MVSAKSTHLNSIQYSNKPEKITKAKKHLMKFESLKKKLPEIFHGNLMQKWKNNLMDSIDCDAHRPLAHLVELQHIPSSSNTSHQTTMHPIKQQTIAPNQFVTINQQPLNGYCPQCIMPHNELQCHTMNHNGLMSYTLQ